MPPARDATEPPESESGSQHASLDAVSVLPESYGRTKLVLLVVDPFRLHAYWELTLNDRVEGQQLLPVDATPPEWVLRFYDVTPADEHTSPQGYFDIQVQARARNWYVPLWSAGRSYIAEIGLRRGESFVAVCRSGVVHLPRVAADSPPEEPASPPSEWAPEPGRGDAATPLVLDESWQSPRCVETDAAAPTHAASLAADGPIQPAALRPAALRPAALRREALRPAALRPAPMPAAVSQAVPPRGPDPARDTLSDRGAGQSPSRSVSLSGERGSGSGPARIPRRQGS
jgi:hypothetical protein